MLQKFLSRFSNDIAIDLGTANSHVTTTDSEVSIDKKSAIAVYKNHKGQKIIKAVGQEAINIMEKGSIEKNNSDIELLLPIQNGVVSDLQSAEMMVQYLLETVHNRKSLFAPRVMIIVPYNMTSVERMATKELFISVRTRELFLIEAPMAVAVGTGLPIKEDKGSLIVDIGAGTTDIAILSLRNIIYAKSIRVAGDFIDSSIINHVKKKFNIIIDKREAERLKIEVGTAIKLTHTLSYKLEYFDQETSQTNFITVTSEDIREAIQKPLKDIEETLWEVLEYSSIDNEEQKKMKNVGAIKQKSLSNTKMSNLLRDIKHDGIVLSGGSSLIRGLDSYLSEKINISVKVSKEPFLDAIKGMRTILKELDSFVG